MKKVITQKRTDEKVLYEELACVDKGYSQEDFNSPALNIEKIRDESPQSHLTMECLTSEIDIDDFKSEDMIVSATKLSQLDQREVNNDFNTDFNTDFLNSEKRVLNLIEEIKEDINLNLTTPCDQCDHTTMTKIDLMEHKQDSHKLEMLSKPQDQTFPCDLCDHTAMTKLRLKQHKQNSLLHIKPNPPPKKKKKKHCCVNNVIILK